MKIQVKMSGYIVLVVGLNQITLCLHRIFSHISYVLCERLVHMLFSASHIIELKDNIDVFYSIRVLQSWLIGENHPENKLVCICTIRIPGIHGMRHTIRMALNFIGHGICTNICM